MRLLLDTHVAFWAIAARSQLRKHIIEMIADNSRDIWVSVVSIWESSIKHALAKSGRGGTPICGAEALHQFDEAGFATLAVTAMHAITVDDLPMLHGDPFDRLIAAQAISEPVRMVTHDATLAAYSSNSILFR